MKGTLQSLRKSVAPAAVLIVMGCGGCASEGNGTPASVERLDMPAPVIVPEREGVCGPSPTIETCRARFNPSELNVKKNLTLSFSTSRRPGDSVDVQQDAVFALDYETGNIREVVREPTEGRPVPTLIDEDRFYYVSAAQDAASIRVRGVDPSSGALISDTQIDSPWERCLAAAGGDLYFDTGGSLLVARDFAVRDVVASFTNLGDAGSLCPERLASLDGTAVAVEAPSADDPTTDTIALVALDPQTGAPEATPLVSLPVSSLSLGSEGERPPLLAVADDGLYVLASDFVALEVWFVPYERRPGESSSGAPAGEPARLSRITVPFFADVPVPGSTLAVFEIQGFAAIDGVVAIPVLLEETASDGRFFWSVLVVIDVEAGAVDLLTLGTRFEYFGMLRTGDGP